MMNDVSASAAEGPGSGSGDRRNSKRPKYSRFTQQDLPACKPILTPLWVVEIVDRYETACVPPSMINDKVGYIQNPAISKTCVRVLKVPKDMDKPIYVYYQLDNFYQNHRRYVKSRNDKQLRDANKAYETSGCDPEKSTADGTPIVPCGLIAWSLFNDTYSFTHGNGESLAVNKKDISWKSDRDHKFGSDVYPKNFQNGALIGGGKLDSKKPLSQQEDLIVWMRAAALSSFRKLYGRIEEDLKENDIITVMLQNNYNTYSFGGKKKLVLSTTSWLGGKNDFLGIAYLSVGGLCFFLATVFTVLYLVTPRKFPNPPRFRVLVGERGWESLISGNLEILRSYHGTTNQAFSRSICRWPAFFVYSYV